MTHVTQVTHVMLHRRTEHQTEMPVENNVNPE